jgi:hypothetical protein
MQPNADNANVTRLPTVSRDELLGDDDGRIAKLTSEAIKTQGDRTARTILSALDQIEGIVKDLRKDAELLADEIRRHTEGEGTRIGRVIEDLRDLSLAMKEKRDNLAHSHSKPIEPRQPRPLEPELNNALSRLANQSEAAVSRALFDKDQEQPT